MIFCVGYYCLNQTVKPVVCPAGYYCPAGTEFEAQYPCPEGTYNNNTGAWNETSCKYCPSGHYCEGVANVVPDGLCQPGFYCKGGASRDRPFVQGTLVNSGGGDY